MARPKKQVATPKTVSKPEVKEEVKVEVAAQEPAQEPAAPQVEQPKTEVPAPEPSRPAFKKFDASRAEELIVGSAMISGEVFCKVKSKLGNKPLEGFETSRIWDVCRHLRDMHINIEPSTIKAQIKIDFKMDIDEHALAEYREFAKQNAKQLDEILDEYVVRRG